MIDNDALKARYEPQQTQTVDAERQLLNARFSPCGRFVVGGGYDGVIDRWNVSGEEPVPMPPVTIHQAWVDGLTLRADGELAFSADSWGRLACWRYSDETPQPAWIQDDAHNAWIRRIALHPDGSHIATCGADGAVRTWSALDGSPLGVLQHEHDVAVVAFHPGEPVLVTGTSHGEVITWSSESGEELRRFDAVQLFLEHRLQEVGGVRSLAFSTDGGLLAIGGTVPKNGGNVQGVPTVLLFDWSTGEQRRTHELGATSLVYSDRSGISPGRIPDGNGERKSGDGKTRVSAPGG